MKRREFISHLHRHGCHFLREGGRHTIYRNTENGRRVSVPRHSELAALTVLKICKQLDIPAPRGK